MKLEYVVVYERSPNNFSAYLPDLPGCVSTGKTWGDIQENIREAVAGHVEMMLEFGESLPEKPMSLEDAIDYHNEPLDTHVKETLAEHGDTASMLSTTFGTVEVEVESHQPATRR